MTFKPKSEWDAGNKGLNEGLTKLLMTLKNEKASIKQQRIEHGMEAKFGKLPSKDLPKGTVRVMLDAATTISNNALPRLR